MEWDDVRYFLAVARTGRLVEAARELGVEHTTVGRRVTGLEATLGAPLFYRTAAGWRLTPMGNAALPRAQEIERQACEFESAACSASSRTAGPIRLATVETYAVSLVAPNLGALRARHPGLDIEILTSPRYANLTRGEADVALRVPKPDQPELSTSCFGVATFGLFAVPELADEWRRAVRHDSASGIPLAIFPPNMHWFYDAKWCRSLVAHARIRLISSSTLALLEYAVAGEAFAFLPRWIAAKRAGLVSVDPRDACRIPSWIATHREMRRDPRVAALFVWARDVLRPALEVR